MNTKDGGSGGSGHGGSHASPGSGKNVSATHWFTTEIQQMMHGFGDCRRPLQESAILVEEIVHQQMVSLLYQALHAANMRNGRFIGLEDLLFLMRKDKVKLRRLLRYMELKDVKAAALRGTGMDDEESADTDKAQPLKKRRKICYDFLSSIDQTGELVALFEDQGLDEIKHERLMRAEMLARGMDPQQYLEFCESRQFNFSRKYKSQRFKEWMMAGVHLDIKPNAMALEILSYLTYETVAQLVDMALLVKQDKRAQADDPLKKHFPSVCINYHENVSFGSYAGKGSVNASPSMQSPPSTPTSANPSGQNHAAGSTGSSQGAGAISGSSSSKSKSKKRRKSGHTSTVELTTLQAILPSEIREAMRRYGQMIGPFAATSRTNTLRLPRMQLLSC